MAKQEVCILPTEHTRYVNANSLQTFLASDELGDSLNGVEVLIKNHEDFEKTLVAWEEKFKVKLRLTKEIY